MRLFPRPLPETAEEKQRGINMVDLMMWLVIAALLLAAAIQSIGYYQQASLTYQAKSDLAGEHSWAAARTSLDTKAPTSTEMTAALTAGDLKLTNNGGVYNIGVIATTGDKYCLGVKAPSVKGNNVFYSTSDDPNNVMSDVALPAFCGTATEVTTTGTTTVETPSGSTASPTSTATATTTASPTATATATPPPVDNFANVSFTQSGAGMKFLRMAASADGKTLIGSRSDVAGLYVSKDSGANWTKQVSAVLPTNVLWEGTGISDDGLTMVAGSLGSGSYDGHLYVSRNGGATWTQPTSGFTASTGNGAGYWRSISVSGDGKTIVATNTYYNNIYVVSKDGGLTWTEKAQKVANANVAVSANGSVVIGGMSPTISKDGTTSWTALSTLPSSSNAYATSADGSKLLVGSSSVGFFVSSDGGTTWTTHNEFGNASWAGAAVSSDGTKMVIGGGGYLYSSSDSGQTWTKRPTGSTGDWRAIEITADGTKFYAANYQNGPITVGTFGP